MEETKEESVCVSLLDNTGKVGVLCPRQSILNRPPVVWGGGAERGSINKKEGENKLQN
jgi:hypothetical protein